MSLYFVDPNNSKDHPSALPNTPFPPADCFKVYRHRNEGLFITISFICRGWGGYKVILSKKKKAKVQMSQVAIVTRSHSPYHILSITLDKEQLLSTG